MSRTSNMAKKVTLADTLASLRTKQGLNIGSLSDFTEELAPRGLTTGNIALDSLTGIGGYPEGRIVEQFGAPSSGKTTSALQAMGHQQALGNTVMYLDYEKTFDPKYAAALGIDPFADTFVYMKPKSFEEGANTFRALLATGELKVAVFDSVATMVTENELAADTGAAKVADRAKMMHQFLRQIVTPLHELHTTAIFLNHVMDVVDASPMGQKMAARGIKRQTSPGGKALPFYASLRIEFKQIGNLRNSETDLLTGQKVDQVKQTKTQATVVKNKVGDPFGTAVLRVRWGKGFSQPYSVLNILKSYGVVKEGAAGIYTFTEQTAPSDMDMKKPTIRGEDAVLSRLEEDAEWLTRLTALAQEVLEANGPDKVDGARYDGDGVERSADDLDDLLSEASVDEETGELA